MSSRSIEIASSSDGVILAGTLSRPRWIRQRVPAAVIVHGSGRLTREAARGDIRRLVRAGMAVLAYDKRGVGLSGGVYATGWGDAAEATLRTLAADAAAALERVRQEPGVDPARTGYFGASQAGWIIPLAAELAHPPPRFHIIISGAAVSTGVEGFYSSLTGDGHRPPQLTDASEIREQVVAYAGPAGFDPIQALTACRVPTLWLLGERDESVPTFASVGVLESIRAAGNTSHTVIVYANANHGLRNAATGEPAPLWADAFAWLQRQGVLGRGDSGDQRGDSLTVVTLNLWHDQQDWPKRLNLIVAEMRRIRPDVLCLQEVLQNPNLRNQAETLGDSLGCSVQFASVDGPERPKRYGNAVLTPHSIVTSGSRNLAPADDYRAVAHVRFTWRGREIDAYSTHLHHTPQGGSIRETQIRHLLAYVDSTRGDGPVVIAGDFNCELGSAEMNLVTARYDDAFHAVHPGASRAEATTYNSRFGVDPGVIDHIFVESRGATALIPLECEVIFKSVGPDSVWVSDHFGVAAKLGPAP